MTPGQILAAILLAMAISAGGAWQVQGWRMGEKLSEQAGLHKDDLTAIANAGAAQARQAVEKQQQAEQAVAELDQQRQKEKTDGLAENEKLRRAAADSDRRLRIAGSCRSSGGVVSGAAGTASLGDAGTVELSSAFGSAVFDIRAGIIADRAALVALQDYVLNVCKR